MILSEGNLSLAKTDVKKGWQKIAFLRYLFLSIDYRTSLDYFLRNQSLPDLEDDADCLVPASFLRVKLYFLDTSEMVC